MNFYRERLLMRIMNIKEDQKSCLVSILTLTLLTFLTLCSHAFAEESEIEEITVVGSQIRGAKITGALPVSVLNQADLDALGVDSGEELLENLPEMGLNYFTEQEDTSGGVNSARGDIGSYNLRNLGVGNTLVLLNGRRLVNAAGYQTELLGGDYVPTLTVNSNVLPSLGLDRVEVLKDGASAIYGADAVAGVVNNVLEKDFEGAEVITKFAGYDHFDANDVTINAKFGKNFNDGRTNVMLMLDYYDRDRIRASEDSRWGNSDHRLALPEDSPWKDDTAFRNLYSYQYPQLDQSGTNPFTDSAGEFQVLPMSDSKCAGSKAVDTGYGTCVLPDTTSDNYYLNPGAYRDFRSSLKRTNLFVFLNHQLRDELELFAEVGYYEADSVRVIEPAGTSSSAPIGIAGTNYYTNALTVDGENPLAGKKLRLDGWRPPYYPRIVNNDKTTTRFLVGLRGTAGDWDWETAFLTSKAKTKDLTNNRISNNLLTEGFADPTQAAINPFALTAEDSNIERALIDVSRDDESELTLFDFKLSNPEVISLPAGPLGLLIGFEYREESYEDDRDPRLDGTIPFLADNGDTFPFVSDVLGSSPTTDSRGEKDTTSLFAEAQIPILQSISAQLAARYENISDASSTTVGKLALRWDATDWLLFRASAQTAFRAPNLVQVNQAEVARFGTTVDAVYQYIAGNNGDVRDFDWTMQRYADGAEQLEPEESTNTSYGIVLQPLEGFILTYDAWKIEKEKTIGLFGRENNTILDLALLLAQGPNNCGSFVGNPATVREPTADLGEEDLALFAAAGICPVGEAYRILDEYMNMATRTLEGQDFSITYDFETGIGNFGIKYNAVFTDTFNQVPTGTFGPIQTASTSGALPAYVTLSGFGDLLGINGNYDEKHALRLSYSADSWGFSVTGLKKGSFVQTSLTLADGTQFVVPSMTTYNASLHYKFKLGQYDARVRLLVKNVGDERAPTADGYFGYFSDAHQDLGRNYQVDLRLKI